MEQIKKFKLENLLLFFLLMLPFGNFPQLFNLGEDTGSIYLSILISIIFFLWLLQERKLYKPRIFLTKPLVNNCLWDSFKYYIYFDWHD